MNKPLAAVSLDLDNKWSYMKTHGDSGWESYPSYLDVLIPLALDLFRCIDVKVTFFIVGQDAALEKNRTALASITEEGHDIGNHSYGHEPWLHLYPRDRIREEVLKADHCIAAATGRNPRGFRGPGFSWSPDLIHVLEELGFVYDASTFPTWIGPLGRLYYFSKSSLTSQQKLERKKLFGGLSQAFLPVKPYLWAIDQDKSLMEIPVTTMPFIRSPIHLSYLTYLARFSETLAFGYLATAIKLCIGTRTGLSFLLHPLDFLDSTDVPELAFFPGMAMRKEVKRRILKKIIDKISAEFRLVTMESYSDWLKSGRAPMGIRSLAIEKRRE